MPVDPQIEAMLSAAPPWPGVRNMDVATLRQAVRDSSILLPAAEDAQVRTVEGRNIPGPAGPLPIRIYWPNDDAPLPVIVYYHGGGYVVGDLDTQDMIARAFCAWSGSIVVSVDYRLAPEHPFPAAPDDAYAAAMWAAAHAQEFGGDPNRLAVAGDSAGGNLAAAVALRARDGGGPLLRAQVNLYGSCNFPSELSQSAKEYADGPILKQDDIDWFYEQYLPNPEVDQHHPQACPMRATSHADLPPAFVGTAECDPSRDDAEAYAAKLKSAGVDVELRRYAGMVHGFASWVAFLPGARDVLKDASHFLKRQLEK